MLIAYLCFKIQWHPITPAILNERYAILIPYNHAVQCINQRSSGPLNFVVNRCFTQAPGCINATIRAADRSLIMQVETSGYLLIRHTLRYQFSYTKFIRLQKGAW